MLYFLAIFLPPLSLFLTGRVIAATFSFILFVFSIVMLTAAGAGLILHAFNVIATFFILSKKREHKAIKFVARLIKNLKKGDAKDIADDIDLD